MSSTMPAAVPASASPAPDWAQAAERRVLDEALGLAGNLPWGRRLSARATVQAGLSPADAALLVPNGAADLAALLWRRHDEAALDALGGLDPTTLKVRERIRAAVLARVGAAAGDEAAVRASLLYLARPDRAGLAARLGWASADGLWRWAGDTSTDENHYSKRLILSGVLAATLAAHLTGGEEAAARQADARIANVMSFETWKAKLPPLDGGLTAVAGLLGRLRYRGA